MTLQQSTQAQLRQYIEQIEALEAHKADIAEAVREKFAEAKATGFDPKIMKKVLAIRKKPKVEVDEEQALLDVYCHALGMAGTPLDDWAETREAAE